MTIESMKTSAQKGFTLIELMIVIAIIGILASIAIPQFAQFRVKAFNSAAAADAKNGVTMIESFYSDNYVYPAAVTIKTGAKAVSLTAAGVTTPTKWNISEKVSVVLDAATGYCIQAKHLGGNELFMAGKSAPAPVALTGAKESVILNGTGNTPSTTDCSPDDGAAIKIYTLS